MQKRTKTYIIVIALFFVFIFSLFGIPILFSVATGVPLWFLAPRLPPFSVVPIQRSMLIEVDPVAPDTLGQTITVKVIDSQDGNPLEGVSIKAAKDSLVINKVTNSSGFATFEYMGATTVIYASKEGYLDTEKVIPRVPDEWVTTRNNTVITQTIAILSLIVAIISLLRNMRLLEHKKKRTPKRTNRDRGNRKVKEEED